MAQRLQKQIIKVPFTGGLDSKTDKKQLISGKLLELKNGVFSKLKQITKRCGFLTPYSDQTVDSDTLGAGSAIYKHGDELLITARQTRSDTGRTAWEDGWLVHSHGPDEDEWKTIGYREPLSLSVKTVQRPTTQNVIPDMALADSEKYACYAWLQLKDPADTTALAHVHATVVELANDNNIIDNWNFGVAPIAGVAAEGVHVVGIENVFHVWIAVPTENDIYLAQINTATLSAAGAPVVKITDLHEDMVWDVCTVRHSVHGICSVVVYKSSPNGWMYVRWFDTSGALVASFNSAIVVKNALTVYEEYDHLTTSYKMLIAYQADADGFIYGTTFNANNTVHAANYPILSVDAGEVRNITGCKDEAADHYNWPARSYLRLYVEYRAYVGTAPNPSFSMIKQVQYQFIGTNPAWLYNHTRACLASKAWNHDGKPRVWFVHDSWGLMDPAGAGTEDDDYSVPDQNTFFLMSPAGGDDDDRVDARLLASRAGGESHNQSISQVVSPRTNEYVFAALRQDVLLSATTNATYDSVVSAAVEYGKTAQPAVSLGPTVQTGGGFVGEADARFQENNFHLYPKWMRGIITVNGASAVAAHWWYCVVYEWTDRAGQRHQSQPSQPLRVPLTGTTTNDDDHVTVRTGSLTFGDMTRLRNVRCVLYRTTNQELGADMVFYRLPETIHKFNVPENTHVDLWDGPGGGGTGPATTDAVIEERETLYTTGDVIGNICPPASSIMNVFQDRIVLVPDEDRTNIWFSKLKKHATAVSFSGFFTKRITDGGDITALAAMDSREIVFKASEIRAFSGPGPNDMGEGGFGEDYLITSDVGCVDRASVVSTDKGILFKSAKGIYILGRGLQVNYIGAAVEKYNSCKIVKSVLVENKNQVRFILEDSPAMLVYDYLVNQWAIFEPPQVGEGETDWDTVDAAIWQDKFVMVKNTGTVFQESTGYVDLVDSYIPLGFSSSWVNLGILQGVQRVLWISLIGEIYNYTVLHYEIFYDYNDTNPQEGTIVIDADYPLDPPHQFRIKPRFGSGRCSAFRIRVWDEQADPVPPGTQQGYSISEIAIEIMRKPGIMKLGARKTY